MLNIIWIVMLTGSVVYSFFAGTAGQMSDAMLSGAQECVDFILKIGAFMVMWSGFMNIAEKSGLTSFISRILSPFIIRVFHGVKRNSEEEKLIAANMTANMLGLSNAATPLGISAMKKLYRKSDNGFASNDMCMLSVINSASIQIVPATLIALRTDAGSANAPEITVPVWIVSAMTLFFAVFITKLFALHSGR